MSLGLTSLILLWAVPFVGLGWLLMKRVQRQDGLSFWRWLGIAAGMIGPLWLIGGFVWVLYLESLPGPDAGLAAGVGTVIAGVGATVVWVLAAVIGFAVLRTRSGGASRP